MTAALLPWPRAKFFAPNTNYPLAGGKVYTYVAGTSTPLATYSDYAGTIQNANPVILDTNGEAAIYLSRSAAYKINILDASNVQVPGYPVDNITSADFAVLSDLANTSNTALGAALIGYQGRTLSTELKQFLQAATGQFYAGNGAHINRLNDRLFVGGATVCDGAYPYVTEDWLYNLSVGWASGPRGAGSATFASLTDPANGNSAQAIIGGAQSKLFGAPSAAAIGVFGVGVNNHTTMAEYAWAGYFECHRENDTVLGSIGIEVDAYQGGALSATNPFNSTESGVPNGYAVGLQMAAGAGRTTGANCTAAAFITANGKAWDKGIIFFNNSISGSAKAAICLPVNYTIRWWGSGTEQTSTINSAATTNALATSLRFGDSIAEFYAAVDQNTVFRINSLANAANYIAVQPQTTTNPPQVRAQGTDTNIDILLSPKGTGVVRFGTYAAGVVAQAGYITINDSSGSTRRLLVG